MRQPVLEAARAIEDLARDHPHPAPGIREPDINARTWNALVRSKRYLGERGFALLTQRWQTLQHVTASPGKIGQTARTALVLVLFEHKMLT